MVDDRFHQDVYGRVYSDVEANVNKCEAIGIVAVYDRCPRCPDVYTRKEWESVYRESKEEKASRLINLISFIFQRGPDKPESN